jgi:hypothetical protein
VSFIADQAGKRSIRMESSGCQMEPGSHLPGAFIAVMGLSGMGMSCQGGVIRVR